MIGRESLVSSIVRRLTKPTPDHVPIVGPKLYGKSVILHHLKQVGTVVERFPIRVYWDIGHNVPQNNDHFLSTLASRLAEELTSHSEDLSELLGNTGDRPFDWIQETVDYLQDDDVNILLILDGLDPVMLNPAINRTLWDQLRSLGDQFGNLTFVTGSRTTLSELCMTEDAQTSHFWNLFSAPIKVGAFQSNDLAALQDQFVSMGFQLDRSGATELANWTGGIPLLTIGMYEYLSEEALESGSTANNTTINGVAHGFLRDREDLLHVLLRDCSPNARNVLRRTAVGSLSEAGIDHSTKRELEDRGLLDVSGRSTRITSRLVERYSKDVLRSVENIRRDFGNREDFESNIRDLLSLRLSQYIHGNDDLKSAVQRLLINVDEPAAALMGTRRVADIAMDYVWRLELGASDDLPPEWTQQWDRDGQTQRYPYDKRLPATERGKQIGLLDMATGNSRTRGVTRVVSKPTYLLLSFLHEAGNFGQHLTPAVNFAASVAVCEAAVELCHSLAADIESANSE
jgi:hypothetical protein